MHTTPLPLWLLTTVLTGCTTVDELDADQCNGHSPVRECTTVISLSRLGQPIVAADDSVCADITWRTGPLSSEASGELVCPSHPSRVVSPNAVILASNSDTPEIIEIPLCGTLASRPENGYTDEVPDTKDALQITCVDHPAETARRLPPLIDRGQVGVDPDARERIVLGADVKRVTIVCCHCVPDEDLLSAHYVSVHQAPQIYDLRHNRGAATDRFGKRVSSRAECRV